MSLQLVARYVHPRPRGVCERLRLHPAPGSESIDSGSGLWLKEEA